MTDRKLKLKLELIWIGKEYQRRLEPRILIEDPEKSYGHTPHPSQEGNKESPLLGGDLGVGNMLICGDNLLALKALEQNFAGKIKCIYIDPPYNTGNAFEHYDDGVEHSIWLSLMKPRIEILHRLLRSDGTLWISIDDDECHYLKVLCDEVFGRKNFVNNVIWEKKFSPQNDAKWLSDSHDHILVYAKNKDIWRPNLLPRTTEMDSRYKNPDNDPRGLWTSSDLSVKTYTPNTDYPITLPSGRVVNPTESRCWAVSKEKFRELVEDNRIWFGESGNNMPRLKRFLSEVQEGTVSKTLWFRTEVGDNQEAKKEIKAFNSEDVFTTPKPERLIQRILTLATNEGDWVLDSFLGSGTTAAVAHKMNRRWIGIELGAHCHTHCLPRLRKVVDGTDQGGISRIVHTPSPSREGNEPTPNPSQEGNKKSPLLGGDLGVGWQGGGGFKYYYLAPSLLKKDKHDNWIIDERYNADMLAAAMAKHEGFRYCPDEHIYWKHGRSTEKDYIFTTTQFVTVQFLDKIHEEMKPDESLLICCKSFQEACENRYANITVRKIPKMLLGRCEFGKEDYSLNIVNLPEPTPSPSQEGNLKNSSQAGNAESPLSDGKHKSPLLGGDLGVGKSDKRKKSEKDNNSKSYNKQRKLFE
ncbi:MAG: Type III restriction-modification system methylation subunit [Candidatus Jettenia ecosi]|uniref:site-specific DNA-methyltransferase (adenine-specific) n=1 Tax=Candidatus Jettenia ecosi TaxID=2494326 RepID=A0A533QE62_9BACT|nr:MAG: Type III restriction-modification system methylation subunit [Candidatus Jettenia ecosi]